MRPDPLPELLTPLVEHPDDAGVLCDFDGTLATIVSDPALARPLPGAVAVLDRLAQWFKLVGIVSGRPLEFLAGHVPGPTLVRRGLYGLDGHPEAEAWRPVVATLADDARAHAPAAGMVEDKGLTITLHYRTAPEHEAWVEAWARTAAADTGMVLRPARMSIELLPPLTIHKGTTVAELARGLGAVCFIGDDLGDLEAFTALDRLAANGVATLKVAVRSEESPPDLLATADMLVDGPAGCLQLLERIADSVEAGSPGAADGTI